MLYLGVGLTSFLLTFFLNQAFLSFIQEKNQVSFQVASVIESKNHFYLAKSRY